MKRAAFTMARRRFAAAGPLVCLSAPRPAFAVPPLGRIAVVPPASAANPTPKLRSSFAALEPRQRRHYATAVEAEGAKKVKKPGGLRAWLWDQLLHVWIGFKLLAANTRVALRLRKQVMAGQVLTRRERLLLERTTADLLRLVPFSFFIIVPAAELLLPVALAMFPNLMPSTFITDDQRRRNQILDNLQSGVSRR
eukprot:Hpha_TRINITY_DN2576_c0_g2::TRINITY_DN2576_c0_g2_i1::g.1375::m.1375/K17800/LETM1, MDM38; LETM1 and EF-hand domain-containing protein 1, mitochondrial